MCWQKIRFRDAQRMKTRLKVLSETTAPPAVAQLDADDRTALNDLYARGTPENTLRTYERDLIYLIAWVDAAFGKPLSWPEREDVALRLILDHSQDLSEKTGRARETAEVLMAQGLRKSLLSYPTCGSCVIREPVPGTAFMLGTGEGRIVSLLVVMDRGGVRSPSSFLMT